MMKKIYTPLFILLFFVLSSGIVKSQSYCSANGNCSYTGAILDFSTSGGLNNISNYFSGCTSGGYKYFSKKKVSVFAGSEFVFRVAAGGYGYKGYAIWVDWNEDGDFNDTGEEVYKSTSTTGNAVTDTIKVPSSAKSGLKRMRVISKNYSIPSSSCGYVGYGEVEDYNVNVVANKGLDLGIMEIESPEIFAVGKNEVTLKLRNGASDSIVSFSVGYKLDNNNAVLDSNVKPVSRVDAGDIVSYKLSNKINVATSGQHSLKIWIYKPNKTQPDDKTGNDTISLTFKTGLSGKYTLGSGGDYTSFSAAISDLNSLGVAGPVTFSILSGNYNTSFALNDFKGMSDVNTVTFDGSSRSSVKISSTGASSSHALITIDKGDYFIIKNMTLQNTYTSGGIGVHLKNGADHNTLYNLDISLASTSNTSHGILASNTTSLSGGGLTANNTTVRKCQIKGGYSGIAFLGRSYTFYNYDNQVIDNIIFNQQRHGIYLESQNDFDIFDNRIEGMKDTLGACVYLFGYNYGVEIDANILKPYKTGVYSYFTNYNNLYDSLTITNNIIADFGNSTSQLGIYLNRTTNSKIYNNTIVTDGTLGTKSEAAIHGVYSNYISIYNNILASMDQTLLLSFQPLYFNSGFPDLDYNLYYYPKKSSKLFYNTKYFDNYTSWQKSYDKIEVPHDKNSIDNKNPNFKSTTDFHISSSYAPYVGKLIYLKEDVDGDKRCKYRNSIGADESQFKTAEPKAGFTVDDTVCYNSPITFLNKADEGDPIAHFWYLNGVFQTNDLHFTKVFQSGTYVDTVTLISINCGGSDTFTKTITVDTPAAKPFSIFIADDNIVNPFMNVQLYDLSTNCPSDWEWRIEPKSIYDPSFGYINTYNFTNFTNRYSQNPVVRFDYPGTYDVCLKTSNLRGEDSICIKKYIKVKPIQNMCEFVLDEIKKAENGMLYDDGGSQGNYNPSQDCEVLLTPCSDTIMFIFYDFALEPGDYLKVYDGKDNNGTPLWDQNTYGTNGLTGDMTNSAFEDTLIATSGNIYFKFNSNASGQNKGFEGEWFAKTGSYPKPNAGFTGPDTVCLDVLTTFDNTSTGDDLAYLWDFEGSGFFSSNAEDGEYTYNSSGLYKVTLVVSNCGGTDTAYKYVYVESTNKKPDADFIADITNPLKAIDVVTFMNMTQGCANDFTWSISPISYTAQNQDFPNVENPRIIFNDTGCYDVTLVSGYGNAKDTITKKCYIQPLTYCLPTVKNMTTDIGISRVKVANVDNSSASGINEYTDYATSYTVEIDRYASYPITIERTTQFNTIARKVWIDWNKDGDFEDNGELVAEDKGSNGRSWTDTIKVPGNVSLGMTRMRIGVNIAGFSNTPCGENTYGEYEDYRVKVSKYSIPPKITLLGSPTINWDQCDMSYVDSGATAYSQLFGNMTSEIKVSHNVDFRLAGFYEYIYTVTDSLGNTGSAKRTITVLPESVKPEITLLGKAIDTVEVYGTYHDSMVLAVDTCSGLDRVDVTGMVNSNFLGKYELKYIAYDVNGNADSISRTVYVMDRTKPIIQLKGNALDSIEVHNTYTDPGVLVTDNYDKTINAVTNGKVDTSTLGTYTLEYDATDSSGNYSGKVIRMVKVGDYSKPKFNSAYSSGDTITIEVNTKLTDPVTSVTDNYYTGLSAVKSGSFMTNFPDMLADDLGCYDLIYKATDGSDNSNTLKLTICVEDNIKPEVKLVGQSMINIKQYEKADTNDLMVTATDNFDPSPQILVSGNYYSDYLKNYQTGFYSIKYKAVDQSGNESDSVIRYINVQTSGIEDENGNSAFKVYPNPNNGQFVLYSDVVDLSQTSFTIYNSLGKQVLNSSDIAADGKFVHLNLSGQAAGVYLMRIMYRDHVITRKITLTK